MKKSLTLLFYVGFALLSSAQSYFSNTTIGITAPYKHNNAGTEILSLPSNDVFSSSQTILFTWEFYGAPVANYLVSDNGYITFDTSAMISDPTNSSIPNARGPNGTMV